MGLDCGGRTRAADLSLQLQLYWLCGRMTAVGGEGDRQSCHFLTATVSRVMGTLYPPWGVVGVTPFCVYQETEPRRGQVEHLLSHSGRYSYYYSLTNHSKS